MAYRVEIGEIVENATGLNITGASVTVRFHGGAQAPVYDAENGGAQITQPIATVNGKIGADYPSGAWVAEGDYDLDVVFGGDTLTFFWPARRATQFVTTLPAGVGTSAPEDGERAIELYDAVNGGAWMRRYRAATSAWDMVGGPPPAGGSLPGSPRTRQEFYLTGSTPPVQHLRYNGASWDYVGTPPTVPVTGSPLSILEVGQSGQHRAGRELALADFSTLCVLPTTPVLLANLTTLTSNLGTGGALTNKGTVTNGTGIGGSATAAQFDGTTGKALYIADTGAGDPFRLRTGTVGAWVKTSKRGVVQIFMAKAGTAGTNADVAWNLAIHSDNTARCSSSDGTTAAIAFGITDVADDRWHFVVGIFDGTYVRVFVDGVQEGSAVALFTAQQLAKPFNIGGSGADGATACVNPHFGRVDEAFATQDILTEDQIRLLYATSFPHGYSATPTRAELSIRRKRRGAALVSADFPSQPVRLHSMVAGALTDAGTGGVALTANGSPVTVSGPDGTKDDAYNFVAGSSQSLSATDTGLPAGTAAVSYGCWFKTITSSVALMAWGTTLSTSDIWIRIGSTGLPTETDAGTDLNMVPSLFVADGQWHMVVATHDNTALDGLKRKLYVDGKLVGGATTLTGPTLGGANKFRIGSTVAPGSFFTGQISRAFVFSGTLTHEQIEVLYQKTSQTLASSIKSDAGAMIEAMDATNVYFIGDTIDSQNAIDLAVAA